MRVAKTPVRTVSRHAEQVQIGSVDTSGLPGVFLDEIPLCNFSLVDGLHLSEIPQRLGLDLPRIEALLMRMRALYLRAVLRRRTFEGDVSYALTDTGKNQTKAASEKCQCAGMTPIFPMRGQRQRQLPTPPSRLKEVMVDLGIDKERSPCLRGAVNAGEVVDSYGPSDGGNGNIYATEHAVKMLPVHIGTPLAAYVDGDVIQMLAPTAHRSAAEPPSAERGLNHDVVPHDHWVHTKRPAGITTGAGESALQIMEIEFDSLSGIHVAMPQMKAYNGASAIDDMNCQRASSRESLNRWAESSDRQSDDLGFHRGKLDVSVDAFESVSGHLHPTYQ